ncbi:hypothetical protein [Gemmata sp.]|uniref:hypothetical protein n=1 Tax=Gemmata sp. TaxID=1914242 RepID=UPI003F7220E8
MLSSEETENEYGRLVFEKNRSMSSIKLIVIGLVVLGGVVAGIAFMLVAGGKNPAIQPIAIVAIAGFGCLVYGTVWYDRINHLRYFENGIVHTSRKGVKSVLFDEVQLFSYHTEARSIGVAGGKSHYTGTVVTMIFETARHERIKFAIVVQDPERHLGKLRDDISRRMADNWLESWRTGESVIWLDGVRFTTDGLAITPRGLLGSKEELTLPFKSVVVELSNGTCYFSDGAAKRSLLRVSSSAPNLFPGLVLLAQLQRPPV